jgi:xylose isomerase
MNTTSPSPLRKISGHDRIEGCDGVEIVYPYEVSDPKETKALVEKVQSENCRRQRERQGGAGVSKRRFDLQPQRGPGQGGPLHQGGQGFCRGRGADKVTCCPLGDGYEFSFQYDYAKAWKHLVETFGEAGTYKTKIPLFIEYKPSETRGRCFVDTAAKACACSMTCRSRRWA